MTEPDAAVDLQRVAVDDLAYQQLRVLLLVDAVAGNRGKLDGLTKLAKLDFLVRYPDFAKAIINPSEDERGGDGGAESRMIRYRYGPWDHRYYPVIGALVGRGLLKFVKSRGGSVALATTREGRELAAAMRTDDTWADIADQCTYVAAHLGKLSGNRLKGLIYEGLPEMLELPYGTTI